MNELAIKPIHVPFNGSVIEAVLHDGEVKVNVRKTCDELGIDYSSQLKKMKGDEVLKSTMVILTTVAQDGKVREQVFIKLQGYTLWLAGIHENKVKEEVRELLINYKLEAAKALEIHFTKKSKSTISNQTDLELKRMNAESRLLNAKTRRAKLGFELAKEFKGILAPEATHTIVAYSLQELTGQQLLSLPEVEKTYTATEIGKELGISPNMVGRLANKHGLKTDSYGITVLDKSKHSSKQVPTFLYYEKGRQKLIELYQGVAQ